MRFVLLLLLLLAATPAAAQDTPQRPRPRDENVLYMQGQRALNAGRWQLALENFTRLAALNGTRRDAALYWMAYAQNRLGQRTEALASLADLQRAYPDSLFAAQARALEVEVRRDAGQPVTVDGQNDDATRLIALQGLLRNDPQRAVPLLDGVLQGRGNPRLKNRALFLLAQSDAPQARQLLADAARGLKSPELQPPALGYLAASRTAESQQVMMEVYGGTVNVNVKSQVVRALVRADDADTLVALARRESDLARRREIVKAISELRTNRIALDFLEELAR
jgi:tetratricopeptide (TPR) repeat protein